MKKYIFTLGSSVALLATFAMPVSALAYSYNNAYYPQQNYNGYYSNMQYQYPLLYGPTSYSYSPYQQYSYYQPQYYNYDYQQPTYYYPQQYSYYSQQTYYGNYQPYNVGGYNISYSYPNVYTHGW